MQGSLQIVPWLLAAAGLVVFAVALYYVEDRSGAEVADILQCSEGSVKTHLSRARAALARSLGDSAEEAP